jgi:hypothetical protein
MRDEEREEEGLDLEPTLATAALEGVECEEDMVAVTVAVRWI